MELFRGYVETKNKRCIEPFKNKKDLKSFDEIKDLPEFAGVLASNVVLVDIDDPNTSEILFKLVQDLKLKCRVYATSRGKHFFFKNNNTLKSNKIKFK